MQHHLTKSTAPMTIVLVVLITTMVTISPLSANSQQQKNPILLTCIDNWKTTPQEKTIEWRDRYLEVNSASAKELTQAMSELLRIPVIYRGRLPETTYSGFISYKLSITGVLRMLNHLKIKVSYDGERIVAGE